jgi:hypothetical protein
MKKTVNYSSTIFKIVEDGEEIKSGIFECCDNCELPSLEYIETIENSTKRTGKRSPFQIFQHFEKKFNKLEKCFQCHGTFCSSCNQKMGSIWEGFDKEHVGNIFLCQKCSDNQSIQTQTILLELAKLESLERKYFNDGEKLIEMYKKGMEI